MSPATPPFFSSLGLLTVKPVSAQLTTKPSAPEFTVQAPNESTIELVIKNQAFTNSDSVNALVYDYRVKDHNSEQWIRNGGIGQLQSDSKTTLIIIKTPYPSDYPFDPALKMFVNSSLIDFQVQAKTGYYVVVPIQGGADIQFNASETSDWSNTQTIAIPASSTSASPSPTATVPEFPLIAVIPLLVGIVFVVFTFKLTHRKTTKLNQITFSHGKVYCVNSVPSWNNPLATCSTNRTKSCSTTLVINGERETVT